MMNNKTFVEASRFLAERMMKQKGQGPRQRIAEAFRRVTSRDPRKAELDLLINDFQFYQKDFQKNPKAAKRLISLGERPRDSRQPTAQLAAYTLLANTLLNLDEAVMQN
jgi:hypothetical protein